MSEADRLPTVEQVAAMLMRYYVTRGFEWEYRDLFAELLDLPRADPLVLSAQARMRNEHRRFQRRATFFGPSGDLIRAAVEEQARPVAAMCRSVAGDGSQSQSHAEIPTALAFHGPFALVAENKRCPLVFEQEMSAGSGVYLWTVPLPEGHLVAYVGVSVRSFANRLREEIELNNAGNDGHWDTDAYIRGVRTKIAPPAVDADGHLRRALVPCEIFLAPLAADGPTLRRVESAIIRALVANSEQTKQFLGNRRPSSRGLLPAPVTLLFPVPMIGLPLQLP